MRFTELVIADFQCFHAACNFGWIWASFSYTLIVTFGGVIGVNVYNVSVDVNFWRRFRFRFFNIGEALNDFRQTLFAFNVLVIFFQQKLDRPREACQRGLNLAKAFFNALCNGNFTRTVKQIHSAHFTHIHADRIRGATGFRIQC